MKGDRALGKREGAEKRGLEKRTSENGGKGKERERERGRVMRGKKRGE